MLGRGGSHFVTAYHEQRTILHPSLVSNTFSSEDETTESPLKAANSHLRKVVNMDLHHLAPQAIRCSLKDLVPYDLVRVQDKV